MRTMQAVVQVYTSYLPGRAPVIRSYGLGRGLRGPWWAGYHMWNLAVGGEVVNKQTKNLRCGNRKGLLGRNDQTHHRMGPKTMESIPPSKRNTQADIQLRTRQTNHQQETDGCKQNKNLRCGNRKGLLGRNDQTHHRMGPKTMVSKSNTIQSTNQAGCPVSPPHMYHPRRPAHQPRRIPKHVAI